MRYFAYLILLPISPVLIPVGLLWWAGYYLMGLTETGPWATAHGRFEKGERK